MPTRQIGGAAGRGTKTGKGAAAGRGAGKTPGSHPHAAVGAVTDANALGAAGPAGACPPPQESGEGQGTSASAFTLDTNAFENSLVLMQHCGFGTRGASVTSLSSASPGGAVDDPSVSFSQDMPSHVMQPHPTALSENPTLNAVKRGFRWQVLIALALAQTTLQNEFRVQRLRAVLEELMLPKLLENKEEKGNLINRDVFRQAKSLRKFKENNPKDPNGKFLMDCYPLFDAFKSTALAKSFADVMEIEEVPAGRVVAVPKTRSQDVLRCIAFGKVEYKKDLHDLFEEEGGEDAEEEDMLSGCIGSPRKLPIRDVEKETAERKRRMEDRQREEQKHRRVLQTGDYFGGIFGTTAVFDGQYKTISNCVFWTLTREQFDQIFLPYADETMKNIYIEAFRQHCIESILQDYPLPKSIARVPIYRKINRPMARYKDHFQPCVFLRGETLFEQDDGPGDVYCLLEGTVRRRRKGCDKTFATGVTQLLTLNSFTTMNVTGRFALLGEDPQVMPSTHRYQCTVMSRYALFFRISGEHFVSALLDDPTLFVQLRDRLTQQIRTSMRLDPVCLSFAPLLREFPESSLQAIAQAAEPRVLRRSVALCEPAQSIKEIFLIVRGEIRDTRVFGKQPTKRLDTPPPTEDDDGDDMEKRKAGANSGANNNTNSMGRGAVQFNLRRAGGGGGGGGGPTNKAAGGIDSKSGTFTKNDTLNGTVRSLKSTKRSRRDDGQGGLELDEQEFNVFSTQQYDFSRIPLVTPDEQNEFNPTLPIMLDKRFEVTVGGGWEGLLVDKWPSGWEGVCTVEAWSLPTLKIRTEFNGLPKPQQSLILANARAQQRDSLGLAKIIVARLPPMSSYAPPERAVMSPGLGISSPSGGAGGTSTDTASQSTKKRAQQTSVSRTRSADLSQSRPGPSEGSTDQSFGDNFLSILGGGGDRKKKQKKDKNKNANGGDGANGEEKHPGDAEHGNGAGATGPDGAGAKKKKRKAQSKGREEDGDRRRDNEKDSALPDVSKRQGGDDLGLANIRRPKAAPTAPPPVDNFLLAVYNGEYKDGELALTNIVRDPPPVKKADMRHCGDLNDATTHPRTTWPSLSHPKKRWFATVPSYEPLPGTLQNQNLALEPPSFSTNTDFMTRKDRSYREKLSAEANFFTTSMKSKQHLLRLAGDGTGAGLEGLETTSTSGGGGGAPPSSQPAVSPNRPKTGTQEFPKRHALV